MNKFNKCLILVFSIFLLAGCSFTDVYESVKVDTNVDFLEVSVNASSLPELSNLEVHFIDVGQADCILLTNDRNTILIDSGGRKTADNVVKYLQNLSISKIDLFILTHPHEDHIGGAPKILDNFTVDNLYMTDRTTDTKIYKSTVDAIEKRNIKVVNPSVGDGFILGELKGVILGPKMTTERNLNNTSIVVKISHGENSFLFTGDAEQEQEQFIDLDVGADVIKVGHHGSATSSSDIFIENVAPTYAVIQVGKGNSYGHPHASTLNKYQLLGIQVFRTDTMGTVIFTSDGITLKHNQQ